MTTASADFAMALVKDLRALAENPANHMTDSGLQAKLALLLQRVAELENKVAQLEKGKAT